MERVVFLLEATGQRLSCLLNPATLAITREAGLQPARSIGAFSSGAPLRDDVWVFSGAGRTELTLDLLFDVTIPGSSAQATDVRELTQPLSALAEHAELSGGYGAPTQVRFLWGKAWNIPAVVTAVSERFEYFTGSGVPRRSWLRMRLLRVDESARDALRSAPEVEELTSTTPSSTVASQLGRSPALAGQATTHVMLGGGSSPDRGGLSGERLDTLAARYLGDAALWRPFADENGLTDALRVPAGQTLRIPARRGP